MYLRVGMPGCMMYEPLLDGKSVDGVFEANEEEGWVKRYVFMAVDGKPQLVYNEKGEPIIEVLKGKVELKPAPRKPCQYCMIHTHSEEEYENGDVVSDGKGGHRHTTPEEKEKILEMRKQAKEKVAEAKKAIDEVAAAQGVKPVDGCADCDGCKPAPVQELPDVTEPEVKKE